MNCGSIVRHLENAPTRIEGNRHATVMERDIALVGRNDREQPRPAVTSVVNHCPVCDRTLVVVSCQSPDGLLPGAVSRQ